MRWPCRAGMATGFWGDLRGLALHCCSRTALGGHRDGRAPGGSLGAGWAGCPLAGPVTGPSLLLPATGEISAAVGCQSSGRDGSGGRGQEGRGMSETGWGSEGRLFALIPSCLWRQTGRMKHEIPLKKECQSRN